MFSEKGFQVFYLVQNDGYLAWLLILAQGGFTRRSDQFSLEPSEGIQLCFLCTFLEPEKDQKGENDE